MRLIDGDRLIKWLEANERNGRVLNLPDVRFIVSELAIIEADGWIRVEDRLPDTDRPVLAVKQLKNGTRDICIARCIPEYQHFDAATKTTYTAPYWACGGNNNIIRWRELPEMPEEGGDAIPD